MLQDLCKKNVKDCKKNSKHKLLNSCDKLDVIGITVSKREIKSNSLCMYDTTFSQKYSKFNFQKHINMFEKSIDINFLNFWGVGQKQQRASEDRYQVKNIGKFHYFAIFDGHSGPNKMGPDHVADFCVQYLHEKLSEAFTQINLNDDNIICETIKRVFLEFDSILKKDKLYGTTCTMILIDEKKEKIYQINLGDSRSIIFKGKNIISATVDHKPRNSIEEIRIRNAGNYIQNGRIDGSLMVSRGFGDFRYKKNINKNIEYDPINGPVSVIPEIKVIFIDGPINIILTSDGAFERGTYNNIKLIELFHKTLYDPSYNTNLEKIAIKMIDDIAPKITDDTTIILISL